VLTECDPVKDSVWDHQASHEALLTDSMKMLMRSVSESGSDEVRCLMPEDLGGRTTDHPTYI